MGAKLYLVKLSIEVASGAFFSTLVSIAEGNRS